MSGSDEKFFYFYWAEFAGKLFGYIVASHEKGLTVMEHMRTSVRQCYGWSLPYGVSVHGEKDFDSSGLSNPQVTRRLRMLARDLVVYGVLVRGQFQQDLTNGITRRSLRVTVEALFMMIPPHQYMRGGSLNTDERGLRTDL